MKKRIKKNTRTPMLAALLCAVFLLVSIFLPYVTAEDGYKEILEAMEQNTSLSLYDFAVTYLENDDSSMVKILGIFIGLAIFYVLAAIFRKSVLMMFFDILTTVWAVTIHLIFSDAGYGYVLAIGNRLIFVACAGMLISAFWMLMAKVKVKKSKSL